jgi:hypothetical protein
MAQGGVGAVLGSQGEVEASEGEGINVSGHGV